MAHEQLGVRLPGEAIQDPDQAESPSYSRIATETAPAEQKVGTDLLTGDESGEDDEHGSASIIGKLQDHDLREDANGREVSEGAGARRTASAGHRPGKAMLWRWHASKVDGGGEWIGGVDSPGVCA